MSDESVGRIECGNPEESMLLLLTHEDCAECMVVHPKGQHLTLADVPVEDRWHCEGCGCDTMPGILACSACIAEERG